MWFYFTAIVSASLTIVTCDYKCLCNYNVEKSVYSTPSTAGGVLGYMYEFDCKPAVGDSGTNGWISVAFEHELGYVDNDAQVQIQTCPGSIPDEDKLPTTPTTVNQTTAVPSMPETVTITNNQNVTTEPVTNQHSPNVPNNFTISMISTSTITPLTTFSTTNLTSAATTDPYLGTSRVPGTTEEERVTTMTTQTGFSKTTVEIKGTTQKPEQNLTTSLSATTSAATTLPKQRTTPPFTSTEQSTPHSQQTMSTFISTGSSIMPSKQNTLSAVNSTGPNTANTKETTTSAFTSTAPSATRTVDTMQTTIQSVTPIQGLTELCPISIQLQARGNGTKLAQLGSKCYEAVQRRVSWSHAEIICQSNKGHLVDIASQEEQDFLFHFLESIQSHTVWLGLHDRNVEEKFVWTSGKPVRYTNWKTGRKNTYHFKQDCVYMSGDGTWDDINCGSDNILTEQQMGHLHAYICQYTTVNPLDGQLNLCSAHIHQQAAKDKALLSQYRHSCYELIPNVTLSWQHAENICQSRGGHLASIKNAEEQAFVQGFLHRYSSHSSIWIGLTDSGSEGNFHWTSGEKAQFTNWIPNHVNDFHENCDVFMPYKNGHWDDVQCGSTHHYTSGITDVGETHPLLCQYNTVSGAPLVG